MLWRTEFSVGASMTADRDEASALLKDVEGIESRIRQLLIYSHISHYLFLWGAIFGFGFTCAPVTTLNLTTPWYLSSEASAGG